VYTGWFILQQVPEGSLPVVYPRALLSAMKRFVDSVAIVTGPSDRGIGGAIAERLGDEGAELVLVGITKPRRLLKRLQRRGVTAHWFEVDVTKTDQINAFMHELVENIGHVDVLINNAGVEFSKAFEEIEDSEWDHLIDVNLTGAMKMTRAVLPNLTGQGGVIINIASVLGISGCPGYHAYAASKAGLIGMTQSLALEIASHGQRAVCVSPALVHTPMAFKHSSQLDTETWQKLEAAHPLGIGNPQDVADVVAFLASHEARWISGISIPVGWIPSFGLPVPNNAAGTPSSREVASLLSSQ